MKGPRTYKAILKKNNKTEGLKLWCWIQEEINRRAESPETDHDICFHLIYGKFKL